MEKIKQFIDQTLLSDRGKDVLVVMIVILVGLGSFELGRLSKENNSSGIKIQYIDPNNDYNYQNRNDSSIGETLEVNAISSIEKENMSRTVLDTASRGQKNFFASNRGSKYYSLNCSAGKTIKQENRVYFATREEAEAAGYELSSSCR
jgi:hypothetical protein